MVGRTPEYLGKKIEAREIKYAAVGALFVPTIALAFTAASVVTGAGLASVFNPGPNASTQNARNCDAGAAAADGGVSAPNSNASDVTIAGSALLTMRPTYRRPRKHASLARRSRARADPSSTHLGDPAEAADL